MAVTVNRTLVHVRHEGRSLELDLNALNLRRDATDFQVKEAVAAHLDRPVDEFAGHIVVRTSQALILRPEAVYG
jgi:hypothetical protein